MGRIAEALKRAERERRAGVSGGAEAAPAGAAVVDAPPPRNRPQPGDPAPQAGDGVLAPEGDLDDEPLEVVPGMHEALVTYYAKSSLISEQYRSLRTRLLSQNPHGEHKIIAITSAIPKEGKSVTTLNLGVIMAEVRHLRVLIVDGDFRRSSLAGMLNMRGSPGLAEVLAGTAALDDVIRPTPMPNLSVISAGRTYGRSAAELLSSRAARPIFRKLREQFHYAIVDTPPATTVSDAGIIGQMCNGVIVVVRLNHTHESTTKRAVRLLQANNIPIIGSLIIGRDRPFIGYGYGYGYGYNYYRYYDYYKKQGESR